MSAKGGHRRCIFPYLKADMVVPVVVHELLTQLTHLPFRLLQPVRHVHFAVHRHRRVEVLLCQLAIAVAAMELAETEVAVGSERPQCRGDRRASAPGGSSLQRLRRLPKQHPRLGRARGPRFPGPPAAG